MRLIHNRCKFIGKQIIKLQEAPEEMPAGETPHSIPLHAYGNLVDAIQPGDRVSITGIYRAGSIRVNYRNRNVKSVYRTHIGSGDNLEKIWT
jgi:DNA replication licensing factor MCM4